MLTSTGQLSAGKSSPEGLARTSCTAHGLACDCELPQDSKGQPRDNAGETLPQFSKGSCLKGHCRCLKYVCYIVIDLFPGRSISQHAYRGHRTTWVLGLKLLKLLEADVLLGLCPLSSSSKSIVYHPQLFPSPFLLLQPHHPLKL